ncbi:SubName: Full=Uncharacterized protein {ECO:0000313/EMBL:CCA74502.1} [Serendipita indica DSM 11827]|uniref:BTB domain-containing protein n=1 Tax=Serendipita indica (strain DSM 11827) TaxID=1109443 RepID=G4TT59_SERID|nr:SubName: Full=Uncharacterized protein {ECO:0000313/EMBL:CCA74502.1} [Serendipita indica DSM 11827]CCA74502.1 hypothetical protein PIIN_08454 [Serendipita indica DSM 11827]
MAESGDPLENSTGGVIVRRSKTFFEGYGDFELQSSDGVVFQISRFLLAYSSPVFSDMFSLASPSKIKAEEGEEISDRSPNSQPIQVTEDALTLDLLLRHIDPRKNPAPLNEATISNLLEAARKYQLSTVMAWFETECVKYAEHPNKPNPGTSLMAHNPLMVLALASEYDLPIIASQAISTLITSDSTLLYKDVNIPLPLYRYVQCLREERVNWFIARIGIIANKLYRGKPVAPSICACHNTRTGWIHALTEVVLRTPKWANFESEIRSPLRRCRPGCGEWAGQIAEDISIWEHEANRVESILPPLP